MNGFQETSLLKVGLGNWSESSRGLSEVVMIKELKALKTKDQTRQLWERLGEAESSLYSSDTVILFFFSQKKNVKVMEVGSFHWLIQWTAPLCTFWCIGIHHCWWWKFRVRVKELKGAYLPDLYWTMSIRGQYRSSPSLCSLIILFGNRISAWIFSKVLFQT